MMSKNRLRSATTPRTGVAAILIAALATLSGLFAFQGSAAAQQFVARVDRTTMATNETLTLDVIYADRADTDVIDFSAKLPDFTIISNRPSSQTRIVNFKRTSQTSWQLTMMPKRVGRLRIPAFQIGSISTTPIDIVVSAALESPEEGAPFSVRLASDRERAFVGEQILVRVLLSAARGVRDLRGAPLEIPNAEATLVNQSEFQRVIGGEPFQVTELVYAVFPRSPGVLSIPALQYTGTTARRDFLVARTENETIEILDPASDAVASQKRPWLPADALALASEWSGPTDSLEVGQPITRTIRTAAASQHAAAIPPFRLPDGPYKQYSEQPKLEDTETSTGILGRRTDSVVLVPTEVGALRLPRIEIDWWNIKEGRWEVARLPSETLQVVSSASTARDVPFVTDTSRTDAIPTPHPEPTTESIEGDGTHRLTLGLAGLSTLLFACCIALWLRVRRLEAASHEIEEDFGAADRGASEQAAFNRVLRSLTSRNAGDIRRDLIAWARLKWPTISITRLEQVSERTDDPGLMSVLAALDAEIYRPSSNSSAIDYEGLKTRLKDLRSSADSTEPEKRQALTELYPAGS